MSLQRYKFTCVVASAWFDFNVIKRKVRIKCIDLAAFSKEPEFTDEVIDCDLNFLPERPLCVRGGVDIGVGWTSKLMGYVLWRLSEELDVPRLLVKDV